jgi:hypothetical protein
MYNAGLIEQGMSVRDTQSKRYPDPSLIMYLRKTMTLTTHTALQKIERGLKPATTYSGKQCS